MLFAERYPLICQSRTISFGVANFSTFIALVISSSLVYGVGWAPTGVSGVALTTAVVTYLLSTCTLMVIGALPTYRKISNILY